MSCFVLMRDCLPRLCQNIAKLQNCNKNKIPGGKIQVNLTQNSYFSNTHPVSIQILLSRETIILFPTLIRCLDEMKISTKIRVFVNRTPLPA